MTIIGVDPHPPTHTASALDGNGKVLASVRVENTDGGFEELLAFASGFEDRRWAVEGASNPFIAPWVAQLLADGERVYSIHPSLTSRRRSKHTRRKNDEVDAENCARALLANPETPAFAPCRKQRGLQRLSRTRKRLAEELKANRMAAGELGELEDSSVLKAVLEKLIAEIEEGVGRLEKEMVALVKEVMPEILGIVGVGKVLGATILAEVGDPSRFKGSDNFASYCGAAPVGRSSGKSRSVRVNPGGNRTMNWVVHMVAQVRLRVDPRSKELVERKRREGKSLREAIRVLKTYIARELYRTMSRIQEKGRFLTPNP